MKSRGERGRSQLPTTSKSSNKVNYVTWFKATDVNYAIVLPEPTVSVVLFLLVPFSFTKHNGVLITGVKATIA